MDSRTDKPTRFLSQVPAGQTVRLVRIFGGHGLTQRLAAMGLVPNVQLEVLRNDFRGQIIVQVKNTKIVLGRGMSEKLEVAPWRES
jgi:Fe2+ transport system protein FeoA